MYVASAQQIDAMRCAKKFHAYDQKGILAFFDSNQERSACFGCPAPAMEPLQMGPEQTVASVKREIGQWQKVAAANVHID